MDGIYSPAQPALQGQQRQQQAQLQQSQGQNVTAAQNAPPHAPQHRPNMVQPQSNPNKVPRRGSVPQHGSTPAVNDDSQNPNNRRPSMSGAQDMMMFNNAGGAFPYQGNMQPIFPVIDTTNVAGYVQNGEPYSSVPQDSMNTMISPQFAGMGMANMFPPTAQEQFPDRGPGNFNMPSRSAMPQSSAAEDPSTKPPSEAREKPQSIEARPLMRSDTASSVSREPSSISAAQTSPVSSAGPATSKAAPPINREKTMYSKSGFDMLKALWLVATRKNPKINLGAVDMSCAFVVTDVSMNDCPIVYVSDNFQNLTGYSQHDIVGQNCRFLQSPDGKVEAGGRREFVDNEAVYNLKKSVEDRTEVQQSLINYRKGGKPFLNLLTMIPIPWDTDEIRYFIGFQIDLVECPDAIASGQELGRVTVNYKHSDIGQYIWTPPTLNYWDNDNGQTLGADDVSTLLQLFNPNGVVSDWHKQSWDKMLLENSDDVIHVLSLKGLFLYLSPACRRILEYDGSELVGNSLSSICHPSDIVPVTRELKEATTGGQVNVVFRIRRKQSGYTWFESHGSLYVEQGKGRKCIILVGRKRPVFALNRTHLDAHGGIGDSEIWTKISTSGLFLFVSSNVRSLLDLQPEALVGTSIQDLMRKESRAEFGRSMEKARRGKIVSCKHEVQNRRGQGLQAQTVLYPGDATEGHKPSFLLAQTKLVKASSRNNASSATSNGGRSAADSDRSKHGHISEPAGGGLAPGNQDAALASDDNIFDELRTTKCSSWQFELRQMEKVNRILAEELGGLLSSKKKRKRRKGVGNIARDCANCHTRSTPEWRRGPSGQRDLCNSCGLRWAKQMGRVSPRTSSRGGSVGGDTQTKTPASPLNSSPLHREVMAGNAQNGKSGNVSSATTNGANSKTTSMMPPPGNPIAAGSASSTMTAIQEERDAC